MLGFISVDSSSAGGLSSSLFNTLVQCFLSSEAFPEEYTWQDQAARGSHPYLD
jgi:hypothetical protein